MMDSATTGPASRRQASSATRVAVSVFGALAALAGIEHGVGEILQGGVAPSGLVIRSWPDTAAVEVLGGEPAMSIVPNLAVTGVLAIITSVAVGIWAVWFIQRPHGGLGLIALSLVLLLLGGGFGPPLIGIVVGVAAARMGRERRGQPGRTLRAMARVWPWLVAAGLIGYLSLVPGVVVLSYATGFEDAGLVSALGVFAFAGLILGLLAARAHDDIATGPANEQARGGLGDVRPINSGGL